jgi:hypothetical protein
MHRLSLVAGTALAVGLTVAATVPALAARKVVCDQYGHCHIVITKDGRPATDEPARGGGTSRGASKGSAAPDPCKYVLSDPQPPKSDPVWGGRTTGAIYLYVCPRPSKDPTDQLGNVEQAWRGTPPEAEVMITPGELAQQALASLTLPKPVLHQSPGDSNRDADGVPYTWVNLPTWYWASPASSQKRSATASLGSVWATVTVTPRMLTYIPGDGEVSVDCPGTGRPWTEADGSGAPSKGGCAYRYRATTDRQNVAQDLQGITASVSLTWDVTWTGGVTRAGPASQGGSLPAMTTTSAPSPRFKVKQILTVNR